MNDQKDYGSLNKLLIGTKHLIKTDSIVDHWGRLGQFYASFETGYVTASTALKRLAGHTEKNLFLQGKRQFRKNA